MGVYLSSPQRNKAASSLLKVEHFTEEKEKQGVEKWVSLSLQLRCCQRMQGRWKMLKREVSPPAKQRNL